MGFGTRIYVAFLPALTLTMVVMAHMLRMTRNSVLSIMSTPYIEMAFLKGLPRSRVVACHALPNALGPIVSVVALNLAYLVVGVVVVENVFVYPGVGQYMVDAVAKRDVPVIQACGLVFAGVFVMLNTLADILAILANPRLRQTSVDAHDHSRTPRSAHRPDRASSSSSSICWSRSSARGSRPMASRNRSATPGRRPRAQMWLGADQIGRDMLTRLIYGARTTIGIAAATTLRVGLHRHHASASPRRCSAAGSTSLLSRLVDVILSIPPLILALIVLGVFGSSIPVLILTIAIVDSPKVFRLARALGMNIVVLDFVEVARMRGEGLWWIIRSEVLPNAAAPLISEFGLRFCFNFLFVAALSFLGVGVQPPYADWGGMVRENAAAINFGLLAPLYPAIAIAALTVGVNLVVDWLLSIDARPSGAQAEM